MARMTTIAVSFSGTAYGLYQQAIIMSKNGNMSEGEVYKTLRELIKTAKNNKRDWFLADHLPSRPAWSDLNYYVVEGWLTYREVYETFSHLVSFGRFLPIPERVKSQWPKPARLEQREV